MRFIYVALLFGILAFDTSAQTRTASGADPAGLWRTISDVDGEPRAIVRLHIVEGELLGVVVGTLRQSEDRNRLCERCRGSRRNQPISGMTILWGLHRDPRDPNLFINGSVLDPDSGDVYSARLRLLPDGQSIEVRGFLMVSMLGRSQTWQRAS
jgi:uncharacterized protein (DUF2147 family)